MKIGLFRRRRYPNIEVTKAKIVRDESADWHINIGYTEQGIGEITILEAARLGDYPLQIEKVMSDVA